MKRFILTFLLATSLMVVSQTAFAQERGFGIGAAVGGPDGLSYKAFLSETTAFAGLVSFSISENRSSFYTHLDYLIHKHYEELDWEVGQLFYYYGGGIAYHWRDHAFDEQISFRLPSGFGFNFTEVPVDIFLELAPTADLQPDFSFYFTGNMGFRYFFN